MHLEGSSLAVLGLSVAVFKLLGMAGFVEVLKDETVEEQAACTGRGDL